MATGLVTGGTAADDEWVLEFCNFRAAWDLTPKPGGASKGEGIVIAHPDTGFTRHPELMQDDRYLVDEARNFVASIQQFGFAMDFSGFDPQIGVLPDPQPGPSEHAPAEDRLEQFLIFLHPSHGTATASVLMSKIGHPNIPPAPDFENKYPNYSETDFVSGVAPMAEVIPMRVTRSVVLWDEDDSALARAIYAAIASERNVGVISASLGSIGRPTKSLQTALRYAKQEGIIVVAAAGQAPCLGKIFDFDPTFPGSDPNTICAAACDHDHNMYDIGFYGKAVDITAPGVNVWKALSEKNGSGSTPLYSVRQDDGTSYATAIVAGACALWQAFHGRQHLIQTYGKERIFDLFKKVLQVSCDTEVEVQIENGNTTTEARLKIKPRDDGTTEIPWDIKNHGAGVLDAERLLKQELPPADELDEFLAGG